MSSPKIESYRFGRMVIDGKSHSKDVIILPERVVGNWWRDKGHLLQPSDLQVVYEAHPEILVVGQGAYGQMQIAEETREALESAGIELISQSSNQAVETYNALREKRLVAGAFHLTC